MEKPTMRFSKKLILLFTVFLFVFLSYVSFKYLGIFNPQGNKTTTTSVNSNLSKNTCTRKNPFPIVPQFNSALDLIEQRSKSVEGINTNPNATGGSQMNIPRYFPALDSRNCLDIFYSDNIPNLKNTGAWFDSENSTPNHLIIKINPEYQKQGIDNLVMTMLLAHELTHVRQYEEVRKGVKMTCVQQEADAFLSQLRFLAILNKDEQPKITNLMKTKYYYILGTLYDLWIQQDKASTPCNQLQQPNQFNQDTFNRCFWNKMQTIAENYIQTIPGYQEHCKFQ